MANGMTRYEAIESKLFRHRPTGRTCSIYGAVPWPAADVEVVVVGWTVRDVRSGIVGIGRRPWATKADAEAWIAGFEARIARAA